MPTGVIHTASLVRALGTVFWTALLLPGCASTEGFPNLPGFTKTSADLSMPAGWDDAYLDRLEHGRSPKTAIAVLEGTPNKPIPGGVELKLDELLITSLVQTGKFDVVELARLADVKGEQARIREEMEEMLAEGIGGKSSVDPATAPKFGKLMAAQGIVLVNVASATVDRIDKFAYDVLRFQVLVHVRAVDTTTDTAFLSETAPGTFEAKQYTTAGGVFMAGPKELQSGLVNATKSAIDSIAVKIDNHYPSVGYVVKVREDLIYLQVGEAGGAKPGDQFIVFRKGAEIKQPGTGKHLGWEKEVIGAVKVASTEKDLSVARLVKLKDAKSPISEGDFAVAAQTGTR